MKRAIEYPMSLKVVSEAVEEVCNAVADRRMQSINEAFIKRQREGILLEELTLTGLTAQDLH